MRVKATDIAITPDFNNSELTLGPTFSTLLKLKLFPKDLSKLSLISSITFLLLLFSNLIKKSVLFPKFLSKNKIQSKFKTGSLSSFFFDTSAQHKIIHTNLQQKINKIQQNITKLLFRFEDLRVY